MLSPFEIIPQPDHDRTREIFDLRDPAEEDVASRISPLKRGLNMWDLSPPLGRANVEEFSAVAAEFKNSFQVIKFESQSSTAGSR